VESEDEKVLFTELLSALQEQLRGRSPQSKHWNTLAEDFNTRVRTSAAQGENKQYTFKHAVLLKEYYKAAKRQGGLNQLPAAALQMQQGEVAEQEDEEIDFAEVDARIAAHQERKKAIGLQPSGVAQQGQELQQAATAIHPQQQGACAIQQQQRQMARATEQQQRQMAHATEQQQRQMAHATEQQQKAVADERDLQGQPKRKQQQGRQENKRQRQMGAQNALMQLKQAPEAVVGKGLGGRGGIKRCVACTMVKYRLDTVDAAKNHSDPVRMTSAHPSSCPYCKCNVCARVYTSRLVLDITTFTRKEQCSNRQ